MNESHLVTLIEEVRARRARGEPVDLEAYREELGEAWSEFREVVELDETFEQAMDPAFGDGLPRDLGEFTLLRELGRGAVGVVYEAFQERLDRRVAVKMLRPEFEDNAEFRERYEREARSCAQVRHPHLVEIHEAGHVDGRLYYVMPLLDGVSLADIVASGDLPPVPELCRQMAGVAEALHGLHGARIVHRDIKPANIVVESNGRFVLADFGLARRVDLPALTKTGHAVGTPVYMSPEQLRGKGAEIDERADVYALGATLYETVSGQRPFGGDNAEAVYHQVLSQRPERPRAAQPACPPDLERVIMKCLEKRPQDRYASAAGLAADLHAIASGTAPAAPPVRPLRRWARRRGAWIAGAATVLLAVGVWAMIGNKEEQRAPVAFHLPPGTQLDLEAIRAYAEANDLPVVIVVAARTRRASDVAPLQLVWPRGKVRAEDFDAVRVDVTDRFEEEGQLVFNAEDLGVLATLEFEPGAFSNRLALPEAVREASRPGTRVTWSFVPRRGPRRSASYEVVAPDLAPVLERIERLTAAPGTPAAVAPLLRAHALLDADLAMAAYHALEPLRGEDVADDSEPAVRLQLEALRRAYADETETRDAASAWVELRLRLVDLEKLSTGDGG